MTTVRYEQRTATAWITLDRPAALNALSSEVFADLRRAIERASTDDDVRAVVLTGEGRAFCAGADLKDFGAGSDDFVSASQRFLHDAATVFDALESVPKPVIAAVNGLALAGGLELVLCCDLVIAGDSARLGDAHGNFGLIPGGGGSIRLPRRVGAEMAKYLMFTGDFLPAHDFVGTGLITKVVPDDQLVAEVTRLADLICTKSPLAIRRMKQLVHDGLEQTVRTGVRLELLAMEAHAHSFDLSEGLAAFGDKRVPNFQGR